MKGKLPKAERSGIGQMLFSYAISDPSGKNIFQKSRRYIPSCSGGRDISFGTAELPVVMPTYRQS